MEASNYTVLPFDIIEIIMELLANGNDMESLKACSLASRHLVTICRKHIFSSIKLLSCQGSSEAPAACRFNRLLDRNPSIADYVKSLTYVNHHDCQPGQPILKRLHSVTSFTFTFDYESTDYLGDHQQEWGAMPSSLPSFIESNRIVHLALDDIKDLPITIFFYFPHLTELHLHNVSVAAVPLPKGFRQPSGPPKLITFGIRMCRSVRNSLAEMTKLLDPRKPGVSPILDLTALEKFYVVVEDHDDMDLVKHVLIPSKRLKLLSFAGLSSDLNFERNLASNLSQGSLGTLKIIQIFPFLETRGDDPYLHFTKELEQIAGKNVLETLIIGIRVAADSRCTTEVSQWSQLDLVLSQPGGFPLLRHVELEITLFRDYHQNEGFPARLEEIGRAHLPWLRDNKQLVFHFEIVFKDI